MFLSLVKYVVIMCILSKILSKILSSCN
jgi:hypothetical protein